MIAEIAKGQYKDLVFESGETSSTWKISIRKDGFSGTVTEFTVKNPAVIEYFGNDEDIFDPIKSSRCSFSFIATTTAQDELLREIAESEFLTFGVIIYQGSDIVWRGWIYPEQTQKDLRYRSAWIFQAGDALALLELVPEPSISVGVVSILQRLFQTPTVDQKNGVAFGQLYDQNEIAVYSFLEWAYYRFTDEIENKMYAYFTYFSLNYYEALSALLRGFRSRIIQSDGIYQIVHIPSYLKQKKLTRCRLIWDLANDEFAYPSPSFIDTLSAINVDIGTIYKTAANFRYQLTYTEQQYLIEDGTNAERFGFRSNTIGWTNDNQFENAVYSNNSSEFTIQSTVYDQRYQTDLVINTTRTSGTNAPTSSGTLTKVSGTGPTTISFNSVITDDDTYIENYGLDVKNNSYYIQTPSLLPFLGKQRFDVPKNPGNMLLGGGINVLEDGVFEGPVSKDFYMPLSKLHLIDIMPNGQDMSSGWSINSSNTTSSATTLGRNVATSVTGTLTSIYQLVTGLETSTNYTLIAESFGASVGNSNYEAFIAADPSLGTFGFQGLDVLQGGVTGSSLNECGYYYCQFNTGGNSSWYMQLQSRLESGDTFEWGNVRLFKTSDLNLSLEDLFIRTTSNHYAFTRRLYNLTERSQNPFLNSRTFGNEILLAHSVQWNTRRREQTGSWISFMYNQAAKYDPNDFGSSWSVIDNGQPNSILRHLPGAAGSQIEVLEHIRQGVWRMTFKVFADSTWFAESSPRVDVGVFKEQDGPPSSAGPLKFGFRVEITATSPSVEADIECYVDGLQDTSSTTFTAAIGGARSELFELFYDGTVLYFIYDGTTLYSEIVDFQDGSETLVKVENIPVVNALRRTLLIEDLKLIAENLTNIQSYY